MFLLPAIDAAFKNHSTGKVGQDEAEDWFFLATLCGLRDLSSPTRDQARAPYIESTESQPLRCQASSLRTFNLGCGTLEDCMTSLAQASQL